jgi:hypothetical protein
MRGLAHGLFFRIRRVDIMKNAAKLIKNNYAKLRQKFHAMALQDVLIGIPSDKAARKEEGGELNNATIGYIMEHGAPEMNIPARPHLIPGVEAVTEKMAKALGAAAKASLLGDPTAVGKALNRVGLIGQNSVKAMINAGPPPMLAAGTLAARHRRGRTGTKPLIDTGQYRNSITYVLRSK